MSSAGSKQKQAIKLNAFSFIELIVVLTAIVAISSSIMLTAGNALDTGRYNAAKADISAISIAINQYSFDIGSNPQTLKDLTKPKGQYGPWLPNADKLIDPWGQPYNFWGYSTAAVLWSNGPNRTNDSDPGMRYIGGDDIGAAF